MARKRPGGGWNTTVREWYAEHIRPQGASDRKSCKIQAEYSKYDSYTYKDYYLTYKNVRNGLLTNYISRH